MGCNRLGACHTIAEHCPRIVSHCSITARSLSITIQSLPNALNMVENHMYCAEITISQRRDKELLMVVHSLHNMFTVGARVGHSVEAIGNWWNL